MRLTIGEWIENLALGVPVYRHSADGKKVVQVAHFRELEEAQKYVAADDLIAACRGAADLLAQCQQAIENDDLYAIPNESQRMNRESECWAAIDKALGEEEDG